MLSWDDGLSISSRALLEKSCSPQSIDYIPDRLRGSPLSSSSGLEKSTHQYLRAKWNYKLVNLRKLFIQLTSGL